MVLMLTGISFSNSRFEVVRKGKPEGKIFLKLDFSHGIGPGRNISGPTNPNMVAHPIPVPANNGIPLSVSPIPQQNGSPAFAGPVPLPNNSFPGGHGRSPSTPHMVPVNVSPQQPVDNTHFHQLAQPVPGVPQYSYHQAPGYLVGGNVVQPDLRPVAPGVPGSPVFTNLKGMGGSNTAPQPLNIPQAQTQPIAYTSPITAAPLMGKPPSRTAKNSV